MSGPLFVLSEPEEEANAESYAITDAETDVKTGETLSKTGGLEIVERAEDIELGVFRHDCIKNGRNKHQIKIK